jgi:hypothetical protein
MVIYRIYPSVSSNMAGRWRIPEPALVHWENHLMVFYRKKLEVPLGQLYFFGSWFWTYAYSFCLGFHAHVGPQPTRNATHWGQGLSFEGTKGTKYHATISPKNELNTFVNGLVWGKNYRKAPYFVGNKFILHKTKWSRPTDTTDASKQLQVLDLGSWSTSFLPPLILAISSRLTSHYLH